MRIQTSVWSVMTVAAMMMSGCLEMGSPVASSKSMTLASQSSVVAQAAKGLSISGAEILAVGDAPTYTIAASSGAAIASASYDFGDGSAAQAGTSSASHTYNDQGLFTLSVTAIDVNGNSLSASKQVNVMGFYDGLSCLPTTSMTVPANAVVGTAIQASAVIPSCFASSVTNITFDFGDGAALVAGSPASHTYAAAGDVIVTMNIYASQGDGTSPFIVLQRPVHIDAAAATPTPTPNPLLCPTEGSTRTSDGATSSQTVSCGLNGQRVDQYKSVITETCQSNGSTLMWTQTSTQSVLVSQGACEKQSCRLPDGSLLADGASRVFYSTSNPESGLCADTAATRTCNNGVLSGSSASQYTQCHEACPGFGASGTVKTGVVTGSQQVPKTCAFGETGIFDTYQTLDDQTCMDGHVTNSNERRGTIVTAGSCPTYSYQATGSWTACSADCGGQQSALYECRDAQGAAVSADRCSGQAMPSVVRVCDGNPGAVAHSDSSAKDEDAGSTKVCPANQLGVIVQERTTTTVVSYACVDHKVQSSTSVSSTPWVEVSYCRDYTAYRCSQDSLSNTQAAGRYDWMVKCQDQVPVIKQFLTEFANVTAKGGYSIDDSARRVYPTFMNHATSPEKPWIAPTVSTASCTVPASAYVAAVCLSSCATPEQEIIAEAKADLHLKRIPFVDALTQNLPKVATLRSEAPMESKQLQKTKVDQWVTELIDTNHDILHFRMASGGSLRLTPNHTVIADDGSLRLASDFKVGDNLVKFGGATDRILAIDHEVTYGKVYNLFVASTVPAENVVVTGGYLNGTAYFQNDGASYVNRALLRKNLTRGVFGK